MHRTCVLRLLALSMLLLGTTSVQADLIDYTYDWKIDPVGGKIYAGNKGGYVQLSDEQATDVTGPTNVAATNLTTVSSAPPGNPDVFGAAEGFYSFALTITQGGQSGSLFFSGQLLGSFSSKSSNVDNIFFSSPIQLLSVGGTDYSVFLTNFNPPGPPKATNKGSITAYIDVVQRLPEPSTMALAGLGIGLASLAAWRKRRQKPTV